MRDLGPKSVDAPEWLARVVQEMSWLRQVLRLKVGAAAADDALQDALLRRIVAGSTEVRFEQRYFRRVATNVAIDHHRRQRARGGGRSISLEDAYDAPALAYLPDQESALLLKQVVMALPPLYRDVFILNRFMGMTYAEIAARYGLSVKAIEYRMSRALALCEEALRD